MNTPKPIMIPIEGLAAGETIWRKDDGDFAPFGAFADVMSIEDDPCDESYYVTVLIHGWVEPEVGFSVSYGEYVQFGGVGEPRFSDMAAARKHRSPATTIFAGYQARVAEQARERIRQQDETDEGWRDAEARARALLDERAREAVEGAASQRQVA